MILIMTIIRVVLRNKFLLFLLLTSPLSFFGSPFFVAFGQIQSSATLSFAPAVGTLTKGQTFWVDIMVNVQGENANAVGAYFSYPEDKFEALGVNTAGAIVEGFTPEKKAEGGQVKIVGGAPTPGFSGIQKIASVGFRVKASSGVAIFTFASESAVLTNAGQRNILNLSASGKGIYVFQASVPPPSPVATPLPPPSPIQIEPMPSPQPAFQEPLLISDMKVKKMSEESMLVSWTTNRPADAHVRYGMSAEYDFSVFDGELVTSHEILVDNLSSVSSVDYHFQIISADAQNGKAETQDLKFSDMGMESFITEQEQQERTGAPLISKIPVPLLILFGGLAILVFLILLFLMIKKMREG